MRMMKVRIRATGQVTEMVPHVAKRMIAGGTAEAVDLVNSPGECMAVSAGERAIAQAPVKKKQPSKRSA